MMVRSARRHRGDERRLEVLAQAGRQRRGGQALQRRDHARELAAQRARPGVVKQCVVELGARGRIKLAIDFRMDQFEGA
ncbi:MAG: hypothetical protein JSR27_06020 [Proteobacteria bacterium]|nr:hypothetical protein [Pseudomonadota bacterium]